MTLVCNAIFGKTPSIHFISEKLILLSVGRKFNIVLAVIFCFVLAVVLNVFFFKFVFIIRPQYALSLKNIQDLV